MKKSDLDCVLHVVNEEGSPSQLTTTGALVRSSVPVKQINDYVMLKKIIKQEGLFNKQPVYYATKFITTLGLMALSIAFLFTIHFFWFQIVNAVLLAVASAQFGFLGHDGGHRQVF